MPDTGNSLAGKALLLGVTGGIACYKSVEVLRGLMSSGADVTVIMTDNAARFVTPLTFGAISGKPVLAGMFDAQTGPRISHIELTGTADAVVVAPATANIIGKMASGIADDLLSTMLVAARCPVVLAPSMNRRMYDSPALKRNVDVLKDDGVLFIGPEKGWMACNEYGWGRMSEPGDIVGGLAKLLARRETLAGKKVLVTAGPTLEDIDPVRFIGNRSSGRMGYAVAEAAIGMGADVTLVSGPVSIDPPAGADLVYVRSAAEMEMAVAARSDESDVIVMAAAVADYTPKTVSGSKIKKGADGMVVELARTSDIVSGVASRSRPGQLVVGFAAETEDLERNAMAKLTGKGLDLIAANLVGGQDTGFGSGRNRLYIYAAEGLIQDTGVVTKNEAASSLMNIIAGRIRI